MKFLHTSAAAVLAVFSLAACSSFPDLAPPVGSSESAESSFAVAEAGASGLTVADQAFMTQATYGGLAEVALGELASEQAAAPAVQDFGERMVAEHTRVNEELAALAASKGMEPPTAPDPGRQAVAAALASLEGANFDRQYLQEQLAEHEVAIALYEAQASGGSDPDVRAFAARWLPALQDHAGQIRTLMARTTS